MVERITEPYLKARLCLWLAEQGAETILVSVDGAEPDPDGFRRELLAHGWVHEEEARSKAAWTGSYSNPHESCLIHSVAQPGLDVLATCPSGSWVAECKGEPTPAGIKAGGDLTSTYTALGQLLIGGGKLNPAPTRLLLAIPESERMAKFISEAAANPLLCQANITIILVSRDGTVREVS